MAKSLVLTADVLAGSAESLSKVLAEKSAEAANDIIVIVSEKNKIEADLNERVNDVKDLLAINEKLQLEIEKLSSLAPEPVIKAEPLKNLGFKKGEDEYGFVFPSMYHKGNKITALEVSADEELQDELIAIKSGMIYKK